MNQGNEEISFVFSNEKSAVPLKIMHSFILIAVAILFTTFEYFENKSIIYAVKESLVFYFVMALLNGMILYIGIKYGTNKNKMKYIITPNEFIFTEIPKDTTSSGSIQKDELKYTEITKVKFKNTKFTKQMWIDFTANQNEFIRSITAGSYFDHPSPEKWEQLFLELTRRLPPHVKVIAK